MILLIVDDESICRNGMAEVIARRRPEVKVLTACNGVEAAALLERGPVDGMFLDIRMPGCDGFELLQILKQRGQSETPQISNILIWAAPGCEADAVEAAENLRKKGLIVEHSLSETLDGAKAYADAHGIERVLPIEVSKAGQPAGGKED